MQGSEPSDTGSRRHTGSLPGRTCSIPCATNGRPSFPPWSRLSARLRSRKGPWRGRARGSGQRNDRAGRSIASGARPSLYRDGGNAARQRGGWVHPPPRGGVRAHPIVTARRFWPVPSSLWWRPSSTGIHPLASDHWGDRVRAGDLAPGPSMGLYPRLDRGRGYKASGTPVV